MKKILLITGLLLLCSGCLDRTFYLDREKQKKAFIQCMKMSKYAANPVGDCTTWAWTYAQACKGKDCPPGYNSTELEMPE